MARYIADTSDERPVLFISQLEDKFAEFMSISNNADDGFVFTPYDYIFMDCEMPVMDGCKATKLIREGERRYGVHIPIIALSAHAMPEEANKSIDAGMDFHLNKPLQVDKLLEVAQSIDRVRDV